ncbi:MAG: cobalamin-dependent protein [Eubacteriaceae bacterium]|jgi:methanogenic corrinoid protein MtbC1|nr:cobalamin-dependent protein [Eubacteriaceae bacterium]
MEITLSRRNAEAEKIAEKIFEDAFLASDEPAARKLANSDRKMPLEGIVQTVLLLDLAVRLDEPEFFAWTGQWTMVMMSRHMPFMSEEQVRKYLIMFCLIMKKHLWWLENDEQRTRACAMLDAAADRVSKTVCTEQYHDYISEEPYAAEKAEYIGCLLKRDIRGAGRCIMTAVERLSVKDVYTKIIQEVMYAIGEMWLQGKITVAQEHYCTAATQTIVAQVYPRLIDVPRDKGRVVIACIGSELHELGARMISDILESEGWDSIFLGAAVPLPDLISVVQEEKPQVCILSVALQQGVLECIETVAALKNEFPDLIVAVGGHAFSVLRNGAGYAGADIFASSLDDLIEQMNAAV